MRDQFVPPPRREASLSTSSDQFSASAIQRVLVAGSRFASCLHNAAPELSSSRLVIGAKGQEGKSAFVLNVVDGCLPSDLAAGTSAEIQEARRLLHVAMTRQR